MTFKSLFKRKRIHGVSSKWIPIGKESTPETMLRAVVDTPKEAIYHEPTESSMESRKELEDREICEVLMGGRSEPSEEETREVVSPPQVKLNAGLDETACQQGMEFLTTDESCSSTLSAQPSQQKHDDIDNRDIMASQSDDSSMIIDIDDFEEQKTLQTINFVRVSTDGKEVEIEARAEHTPSEREKNEGDVAASFDLSRVYRPFANAAGVAEAQGVMASTRDIKKPAVPPSNHRGTSDEERQAEAQTTMTSTSVIQMPTIPPSNHREPRDEEREETATPTQESDDEGRLSNISHPLQTSEKEFVSVVGSSSFNVSDDDLREIDEFLNMCLAEEERRENRAQESAGTTHLLPPNRGMETAEHDDESTVDIFKSIEDTEAPVFVDFQDSTVAKVPLSSDALVVSHEAGVPATTLSTKKVATPKTSTKDNSFRMDVGHSEQCGAASQSSTNHRMAVPRANIVEKRNLELIEAPSQAKLLGFLEKDAQKPKRSVAKASNTLHVTTNYVSPESKLQDLISVYESKRFESQPHGKESRIEMLKQKFESQNQGKKFVSTTTPTMTRRENCSYGDTLKRPAALTPKKAGRQNCSKMLGDDESIQSIGYTIESTSVQSVGLADDTFDTDDTSDIQSIGDLDDMSEYTESDSVFDSIFESDSDSDDSEYNPKKSTLEGDYKSHSSRGASDNDSAYSDEFVTISERKKQLQRQHSRNSSNRSSMKMKRGRRDQSKGHTSESFDISHSRDGRIVDCRRSSRRSDGRRDDPTDDEMEIQRHRRRLV